MDKYYLKPCPFCGGNAKVIGGNYIPEPQFDSTGTFIGIGVTPDCEFAMTYVECEECGATGQGFDYQVGDEDPVELASRAWNKRI